MSGRGREAERAAFSVLYEKTHADVLGFLLRRCPTPEDAADCLAETYLVAWQKRRRMPTGSAARPWLFGVARNIMRRGNEARGRTAQAAEALATALHDAGQVAPEQARKEADPVMLALDELPQIEREIITLICWDGLRPREVAIVLGISPNVVRVRAHRARAKLRSALAHPSSETPPAPARQAPAAGAESWR